MRCCVPRNHHLCTEQPGWLQAPDREFLLRMSFVEVYNEVSINITPQLSLTAKPVQSQVLYDLLADESTSKLSIVPDPALGVAILDLTEEFVCQEADMHRCAPDAVDMP